MGVEVYPYGSQVISVPATQSIAVSATGDNPATVYQDVGYPNIPAAWKLIGTVLNTETVFGPYSPAASIRIDAGANPVYYQVGASPAIGVISGNITFDTTPGSITGVSAAQGGSAALIGGTSSTSANAGGAVGLTGGVPGATGVGGAAVIAGGAGGATSGAGGDVTLTGGAGTAGNASGGSVILAGGAKNGSGLDGGVFLRGTFNTVKQAAPSTATAAATLTVAQIVSGILMATPATAVNYTLPTGTDLKAALPADLAANDSFTLTIVNLGGTGDDITVLAGADFTIEGNPVVTVAVPSQGMFRVRFVTGVTFIAYRVA